MKVPKNLRCMMVDDDRDVLAVMSEVIPVLGGAEVVCFSNPIEAIQALRDNPRAFDLVISDFDMPELDGVEMCHVMRELAPELRTILATGNSGITKEDAGAQGFDALLHKPYPISALQMTMNKVRNQTGISTPAWLLQAA
ncbi:MAG: sensory box histidine kinase/response regulator [Verrucomicrobiales bacterium]|nr:sensory box histidine kinase/response regulator [Verrucomicrobiales bacterium]